jgi:hypothetical protein
MPGVRSLGKFSRQIQIGCDWHISAPSGRREMFGIEWLRSGSPVEKGTSVLTSEAEVIAGAMSRALDTVKRHPGKEPDSFRLTDATGKIVGVFQLAFDKMGHRPH